MAVASSVEAPNTVPAAGAVHTGDGSSIPIAFVSVSADGSKQSGTSNVRTTYNKTTRTYEITLDGVRFNRTKYTALATVSGWNGRPLFINTDDSADGKLLVDLRDVHGALGQADFQLAVFKA